MIGGEEILISSPRIADKHPYTDLQRSLEQEERVDTESDVWQRVLNLTAFSRDQEAPQVSVEAQSGVFSCIHHVLLTQSTLI